MSAVMTMSPAPAARIVHGRIRPTSALPTRSLGLGQHTVTVSASGLPQLLDPRGQPAGLFANEQLAAATAHALSR